MKAIFALTFAVLLSACAYQPSSQLACYSTDCMLRSTEIELAQTCISDLFHYPKSKRKAIDAEYRYPLTSVDTYFDLSQMGYQGPTPQAWCEHYARKKVRVQLPGA